MLEDITARRGVEQQARQAHEDLEDIFQMRSRELIESRNHMRAIFDNAPVELYLKDREGRYVEINHQFERLFNVLNEDVKGKLPEQVHDPDLSKRVCAHDQQVMQSRKAHIENQFALTEEGERTLLTIKFPIFDENDEVSGLGAVVSDITELENARKEALKASNAKSEFLSSMSHELRTPLNAILGFAQVIDHNKREPLTDSQQVAVLHIIKGGEHLLDLINDVLDLAKIDAAQVELSIESIKIVGLIDEILPMVQTMARDAQVEVEISSDQEVHAQADFIRLKQILLNLISNALKYNRPGGKVYLDWRNIGHDDIHVSVRDTGFGIAAEDREKLFQPFSRLGGKSGQIEGTGIGLAICRRLVEQMGGAIQLDTQVGTGSTFSITLPRSTEPLEDAPKDDAENEDGDGGLVIGPIPRKVLYVEDNPANLELMEMILESTPNLELLSAHNAEIGLVTAREQQPDLILMDINLPGMNGIQALHELRKFEPLLHTPVIAVSAAAMAADIRNGMEAGFDYYLTKPFDILEVRTIVGRFLGGTAAERSE